MGDRGGRREGDMKGRKMTNHSVGLLFRVGP